jgi:selenocysteine-specific elongation factor
MQILPLVVGTAGHIDHGKSSLVKALTGIDPDRLKEEQERGLTIDLGFANLPLPDGRRLGLVDVPGHERFIRNMVAGATGIDLVLLVVAADDGVMPQTREHLAIMQILGLSKGLIALNKVDLVAPELVQLAAEDVRQAVRGTFLEDAPLIEVSAHTGAGIEDLRAALIAAALATAPRSDQGLFRMPIQRVFSKPGFGTVVTGIPLSGAAAVGDELELLPLGQRAKVRGLQAYGGRTERVRAGHSSALNLSDLERDAAVRGHVLATPGYFHGSALLAARVTLSAALPRPLKDRTRIRLHAGTDDPAGELVLLEGASLAPGESALAQLRLDRPTVVAPGDRFVLRLESPELTLGGGVVLEESRHRLKRGKAFVLDGLGRVEASLTDLDGRLVAELERSDREPLGARELAERVKEPLERIEARLAALGASGAVVGAGRGPRFASARVAERDARALAAALAAWFKAHPERQLAPRAEIEAALEGGAVAAEFALEVALARGLLERLPGGQLRLPGPRREMDPRAKALFEELERGGLMPKGLAELSPNPAEERRTRALLDGLVDLGLAVRAAPGMYFSQAAFQRALAAVEENCRRNGQLEIPELREALGTTRKFLIPLLEHLDAIGVTLRQGAHRVLRRG